MVIKRADFPMQYVDEKKFKYMYVDEEDFKGYLGQIHIIKANQPPKELGEDYIERANSGCKWLEFYPENSNVAMTVAYSHENKILNWYFDIINKVGIENNNPYFEDLYLDVTLTPQNKMELLDEEELKQSLKNLEITEEEYKMAYQEANNLISVLQEKKENLKNFTDKCLNYFEN